MQVKSIQKYTLPAYPTRECFAARPELLLACMPRGWRGRGLVAGTLLAFAFGGCTNNDGKVKPIVAPIYKHGEGRGMVGGRSGYGTFITEEEARHLIKEELKKHGVVFDKTDYNPPWLFVKYGKFLQRKKLVMDGYSSKCNLGYEYMADEESTLKDGWLPIRLSTAYGYNTLEDVAYLRKKLQNYGKMNAVIFYEPVIDIYDVELEQIMKRKHIDISDARKLKSAKLIRAQVRDFIKWAKKNGVLKACDDNK